MRPPVQKQPKASSHNERLGSGHSHESRTVLHTMMEGHGQMQSPRTPLQVCGGKQQSASQRPGAQALGTAASSDCSSG
jgi:hypothetical protein